MEQEAAVQERREQLKKEGKINKTIAKELLSGSEVSGSTVHSRESVKAGSQSSEAVYETLVEILQAEARVDAKNASWEKQRDLRIKAVAEPPSLEEIRRIKTYVIANKHGFSIPKLTMGGRNRYQDIAELFEAQSDAGLVKTGPNASSGKMVRAPTMSAESLELANRSYAVGVRALVYGSMGAVALVTLGGVGLIRYFDVKSPEDVRYAIKRHFEPYANILQKKGEGIKSWMHGILNSYGFSMEKTHDLSHMDGEVQRLSTSSSQLHMRLKRLYSPSSSSTPSSS